MSDEIPKLTPEQGAILACINAIDHILAGLTVGFGAEDWSRFHQDWIQNSQLQVGAIFEKAEKQGQDNG